MSKFDKIEGNMELIKNVVQKSAELNSVGPKVKMLTPYELQAHPRNNEDVSDTGDLELSIIENGFTDPVEVNIVTPGLATEMGLEQGYVIMSGHRRSESVKKLIEAKQYNKKKIPCVVYEYNTAADIENHMLMANAHRDSSKDPLMMYRRVMSHRDYLKNRAKFNGNIAEEISKRLGISLRSVNNRIAIDDLVEPIKEMITLGDLAESSALPICTLIPDEQDEICAYLKAAQENGEELTRAFVKAAVDRCSGKEPVMPVNEIKPQNESANVTEYDSNCGDKTNDDSPEAPESIPEVETAAVPESVTGAESEMESVSVLQAGNSTPVVVSSSHTGIDVSDLDETGDNGGDANSSNDKNEDYPIDPAIVNKIIEEEFEAADKRKMKQTLGLLGQLEDVAGLGVIEWAELKNKDEALDTVTLIGNVVVGLVEEVFVIGETFELVGEDSGVDEVINKINLITAKMHGTIIA